MTSGARCLLAACIAVATALPARAESIKLGVIKIANYCADFVAYDKGYFAAEGFTVELAYFDAAAPIAVATVSGDLDFGTAGISGGLYSLAAQGALRLIGGNVRTVPGFHDLGVVASNRADAAGLRSFAALAGHSVAVATVGSPTHYALGLIAEKYGIDLNDIRVLPLQGIPNMVAAVTGGQADAGVIAGTAITPGLARGDIKLLGWVGDETPFQFSTVFVATKTADQKPDDVARFLRAFRRGSRDCHDAFVGADERPHDGPTAPEILGIIAKHTGQPPEMVHRAIGYTDADARLDVPDIAHQVAWYKAQKMLKGAVEAGDFIDTRYVVPLAVR